VEQLQGVGDIINEVRRLKEKTRREFDRSVRYIARRILAAVARRPRLKEFGEGAPCFFVLSTGRTGTQTLAALLNLSPEAFVYHEPSPRLNGLSVIAYKYLDEPVVEEVLAEAFRTSRWMLFRESLACGKGYGETSHGATFLVYAIHRAVPVAKFIHLVRHTPPIS